MKYMGSKRWMLSNGLGDLLQARAATCRRFYDLFSGSAAVAVFVATNVRVKVHAVDTQAFSVALANSVLARTEVIDGDRVIKEWVERAMRWRAGFRIPAMSSVLLKGDVQRAREWCARNGGSITNAYGGHYFSPEQAIWLDGLRETLPRREDTRAVALGSLVEAASKCAAAPGHTAQPFQPTRTAFPFLRDAWNRDVLLYLRRAACRIGSSYSKVKGTAQAADCADIVPTLSWRDVVFIDPPYSGVQYSRFYHVLETVVTKRCGEVSGVGRYPAQRFRPVSKFSMKHSASESMGSLLAAIACRGASVVLTFPDHECSNGLSGEEIRALARCDYHIREKVVDSRFSTLGGTRSMKKSGSRSARQSARELILDLRPKG